MIQNFLTRILLLLMFGALQVLLFNQIHFMGYGTPLVYVAFLLSVPVNANRSGTLLGAFVLGVLMDSFANTPGVSAAAITLTAFVQPTLLKLCLPKEYAEDMVPNHRNLGWGNMLRYITLLLFVHHSCYFLTESFSYFNLTDLCKSAGISLGVSWMVIVAMESLRGKARGRVES